MRFMLMMKADPNYEAGAPPDPALMASIEQHVEAMTRAGILVETGGLFPSSHGARVRLAGGQITLTDGPFTEIKELIGGYAIVEATSKQHAIELARDFLRLHQQVLGADYAGESEIREMMGVTRFAAV